MEEVILFGVAWRYELDAYVVMPDHVHVMLTPFEGVSLAKVLQGIKGYSAWRLNRISR